MNSAFWFRCWKIDFLKNGASAKLSVRWGSSGSIRWDPQSRGCRLRVPCSHHLNVPPICCPERPSTATRIPPRFIGLRLPSLFGLWATLRCEGDPSRECAEPDPAQRSPTRFVLTVRSSIYRRDACVFSFLLSLKVSSLESINYTKITGLMAGSGLS